MRTHTFSADLWLWTSTGSWVFLTVPPDASDAIRAMPRPPRAGFGSIRVKVTLGGSRWATSIFPESKSGCYVLPVKKAVRVAEGVDVGDAVEVTIETVD